MSNKFLLGIGAAFFIVFAIGVGAVVGIARMADQTTISDVSSSGSETPRALSTSSAPFAPKIETGADTPGSSAAASALVSVPDRPTGIPVTSDDINQLAAAVKLGAENTGDVRREVWVKETPVAEQLLHGVCDCDQRNWLIHFVQTGKEAMAGSQEYHQSIEILATLRRGNADLAQRQGAH